MTQEDKNLLLRDLCARLPYGVVLQCVDPNFKGYVDWKLIKIDIEENLVVTTNDVWTDEYLIEKVKPYLRPMSSMTEEERKEYWDITSVSNHCAAIDWLNARHFDYRGLIEKGLALEAPDGMY